MIAIFSFYSRNVQKNRNLFSLFVYFYQLCEFSLSMGVNTVQKMLFFSKTVKKKHRQKISADAKNHFKVITEEAPL